MIREIISWFTVKSSKPIEKPIMLIDGDSAIDYEYIDWNKYSRVIQVQVTNTPRRMTKVQKRESAGRLEKINLFQLNQQYKGKETTDKYICVLLQKCVSEGKTNFEIMSSDADFYQISDMVCQANPDKELSFKIIVKLKTEKHTKIKSKIETIYI